MNPSLNQIIQKQRVNSTTFLSRTEKETVTPTSYISDLNTLLNEKLRGGKLLAKMLVNSSTHVDFVRLEQEFVQLTSEDKVVKCAATSLLAPCPKQKLYRNIGFLIDADKAKLHVIADSDVGSIPVDSQGHFLQWDCTKKAYKNISIRRGKIINPGCAGSFALSCNIENKKLFQTTRQLKDYMVENAHLIENRFNHNEVVCEYATESVMAILITFNRHDKLYDEKSQIIHDGLEFRKKTEQILGLKFPIVIFDCERGTICQQEA
ncbi:hypothetical protein [Salinisphaera sp. G21_0]|uniref:hypothetical protein n=1 Tax=Salinisphaera sp. G21_0 TaxID=2821094 RepID=UPI001ADAB85E|nr:hypothetical protein [Salinisphaera sp. G21_0]MBO9482476.1 hypothetical protein [Salinisphaera sp. G21_0]